MTFVNMGEDQTRIVDTAMALIRYAVDNGVAVDGLSNVLQTLSDLNTSDASVPNSQFSTFLTIVLRGDLTANPPPAEGVGGEANIQRSSTDNQLETFVSSERFTSSGNQRHVEFLSAMFHEGSHGVFGRHWFSFSARSDLLLMSRPLQITDISSERSYAAGHNFVQSLLRIRDVIRLSDSNGRFQINGRTYDADDLDFNSGDVQRFFFGTGQTGLFGTAWERYENRRILALRDVLPSILDGTRPLPSSIANDPEKLRQFIANVVGNDMVVLRDMPDDLSEEEEAAYRLNIRNYRMGTRRPGDINGDGITTNPAGSETGVVVAPGHPDFEASAEMFVNGVIKGVLLVDGAQLGMALGSVLGKRLTDNPFGQIAASASLSTVLGAIGEFVDTQIFNGQASTAILAAGLRSVSGTFLSHIESGGIGSLSSYLAAELFEAIGVEGLPNAFGQSIASAYLGAIISNLPALTTGAKSFGDVFNGVRDSQGSLIEPGAINLPSLVGSFIGSRLANEVHTFQSVGGQIGSAVGSIYGGFAATATLGSLGISAGLGATASGGTSVALAAAQFAAANPVLAVAVVAAIVFIDTLLGGLIGSVFGGTPRSGADTSWDSEKSQFVVTNAYSKKGGSKDAANALAGAAAGNFNAVLSAAGSHLLDPQAVQSGNYGMRKSEFVYRPVHSRDKNAITARFTGKNSAQQLIDYGTYLGLSSMLSQMAGGDVYVKRAMVASLGSAGEAAGNVSRFDMETLLGDVTVASDYGRYQLAMTEINLLIAAAPQTAFSAAWIVTLTRADELGLNRRSYTDWIGGYRVFLDEVYDGAIDGTGLSVSQVAMGFDREGGVRYWTAFASDGSFLGFIDDTIEAGAHSHVQGTDGSDAIRFGQAEIEAPQGASNAGLIVNGDPLATAQDIDVAASVEAGGGDDFVQLSDRGDTVFGGAGNDTLYGGRLDDWLFGEEGNDVLHAGSETGALGGHGNYLSGGAGDDQVFGREGSDWLEGGEGVDLLDGGGGDDILTGGGDGVLADGSAAGDTLRGGHGGDQYLLRIGDGADLADESAAGAVWGNGAAAGTDRVKARFAGIAAGTIARNWRGDVFDRVVAEAVSTSTAPVVAAAGAGGEDAIVFELGIGIGDIRLTRLGGANGADLLVEVIQPDADGAPALSASLAVRDWFSDPFKRIEWLKFADGTEIRIGDFTSFVAGTAGGDVIIGTEGNDFVYAGDGDDEIRLLAGNDFGDRIGAANYNCAHAVAA